MSVIVFIMSLMLFIPELKAAEPERRSWSLELPLAFPEGLGGDIHYHGSPYFSLNLFYQLPTPLRVKTQVKSRKLVERDGLSIRSPTFDLPFRVDLGPHHGVGASYRPFASAFYVMLAFEWREVRIRSIAESHLEIVDAENRMMTNTLFQATARTLTEQSLLRPSLGYRWDLGETDYFFSLYSGWSRPLEGRSTVKTEVRVRNPEASHPAEVDARNLQEAENEQARILEQKLVHELRKFEKQSLPVFGVSLGKFL